MRGVKGFAPSCPPGYTENSNLFIFPYDWRQDFVVTAGKLADFIVQICLPYNGKCSIILLAHSAGGLIARCLLEAGDFDDRLGTAGAAIASLITIGTPSEGAPEAASRAFFSLDRTRQRGLPPHQNTLQRISCCLPPGRQRSGMRNRRCCLSICMPPAYQTIWALTAVI
jgi:hypothetical protein